MVPRPLKELTREAVRAVGRRTHWTIITHHHVDLFTHDDGARLYAAWNNDGSFFRAEYRGERVDAPDQARKLLPLWLGG